MSSSMQEPAVCKSDSNAEEKKLVIRLLRIQSRICIGGPALNTINLSAGLSNRNYQTLLVGGQLLADEKSMIPFARERGVAVQLLPEMGRSVSVFDDWKAFWRVVSLIKRFKPHVVHTHTAKAGAIGRLAAWYCRVPLRVHTFHGHVFHGYFSPLKTRLAIWTEQVLARLSHRIIAISKKQHRDLTQIYKIVPERKCRIVPLGFELNRVIQGKPGSFREQLGLDSDVMLCGILARLVPIKNHRFLVESIAAWKRRFSNAQPKKVKFLIIGDGELREDLETQVRAAQLEEEVIFTGWIRETDAIYADLDLNMLVSMNEGTPVTLIEGMAAGVPILAKDVGGIRDIAPKGAGHILDADCTHQEFAAAIQEFVENPARLERSIREEILRRFGVDRLIDDMDRVYQDFFKKAGTP